MNHLSQTRLIWPAAFLAVFGLVNVYSASMPMAAEQYGDPMFFARRQLVWLVLGVGVFLAAARLPLGQWRRIAVWGFFGITILLVGMKLFGIGAVRNGAARWIQLGPVAVQPSEFAKPLFALYLAKLLSTDFFAADARSSRYLSLLAIASILLFAVAMQPDLGGAVLLAIILGAVALAAGAPARLIVSLLAIGGAAVFWGIQSRGYRSGRMAAFLDPWADAQLYGFQLIQSYIALGNGGLWGRGVGLGTQKLFYLPEAHTDFIFAVIGEEWGFFGAMVVLLMIGWLLWELFRIVLRTSGHRFAHLAAVGIFAALASACLFNLAVTTGLMPTKGLALPLVSYGGSAMISTALMLGVMARLDQEAGQSWPG